MKYRPIIICLGMVLTTFLVVHRIQKKSESALVKASQDKQVSLNINLEASANGSTSSGDSDRSATKKTQKSNRYWERVPKPFPVSESTERFEWTSVDGRSEEAIKSLANNSEMVDALIETNNWTKRRQLVYVNPDFTEKAGAVYRDELREIILPGFDGEEFKVSIDVSTDFGEWVTGSFTGTVEGFEDANVVAGSDLNYWSIGIDFKDRHYQIENREEGEWMVSEIDLAAMHAYHGECKIERSIDDVGL